MTLMPRSQNWVSEIIETAAVLAAIWLWTAAPGRAQEASAIHSKVNLVNVAFTARDSAVALLDALASDDVRLFEDSLEQKIAYFAKSREVPLTLGLIVDQSGSQDRFAKEHERDLALFLENVLGPHDRAFLLCFANHLRLVSDFTQSAKDLLERWKRYEKKPESFPEIGEKEMRELGTTFYDSIFYSIEEKLQNADGRRAILIFSDGEDNSSSHDLMTTIEAAQAANVLVYTIRYTGTAKHKRAHGAQQIWDSGDGPDRQRNRRAWNVDARQTDPAELRTMYEIGYYPSNPMKDESFRKTAIRPKPQGVTIRAKSGYFAR
jgi:Ca-activated chloride channel family protein